ncbi:hypothetical protein PI86_09130 [Burkholderia sp. A9]|uniref:ATP-binding protein n=1 Tax=Burkholderia sp. A9 TaxID=1365108 RepID=UPI0005737CCC|nr:ATP-binding protein [Burkholderia sp. A9]KHK59476.1 hypothetical protein PI86_09130 [Burkholderia sp. A9]
MPSSGDDDYKKVPVDLDDFYQFRNECPVVKAIYHSSELELPEDANNPAILALPPLGKRKEIFKSLEAALAVPHAPQYRKWPIELKLLGIGRISDVRISTVAHVKMLDWLYIALRHRYRGLVPTRSLKKLAQQNYASTQNGTPVPISAPGDSHAESITVLGISGAGKTTLIKMVLSTLPMVIQHNRFRSIRARFDQVVWIMVSCPPNGSVATLMKGILHWFEKKLDAHYVEDMKSKANTADYIEMVEYALDLHKVGVLVIDEIQFAFKSADKAQLMGFLTNLLNSNKCTFVLLGTPDARRYVTKTLRNARRCGSNGYISIDPLKSKTHKDWIAIATAIISIDFLPEPPDNPFEIIEVLHEVSAAAPAFAKLAWKLTQYMGLQANLMKVTAALIRRAVKEGFGPVQGLISALRSRNYAVMADCEDLATSEVEAVRDRIQRQAEDRRLRTDLRQNEITSVFSSAVAVLLEMGRTLIGAESAARNVLTSNPDYTLKQVICCVLEQEKENQPAGDGNERRSSGTAASRKAT